MCPKKRIRYHQEDVGVVGKEYEMIAYDNGVYFLEGQMDMGMGMDMDMSELGGGVQEEPPMGINSPRTSAGSGTMSTDSSEDPVGGNSDDEESNLSWLLNFKVDSLFCLDNHEQQKRQFEFDEQIKMEGNKKKIIFFFLTFFLFFFSKTTYWPRVTQQYTATIFLAFNF